MQDDLDHRRLKVIQALLQCPVSQLTQVESCLQIAISGEESASPVSDENTRTPHTIQSGGKAPHSKESDGKAPHSKAWPHAPLHRLSEQGSYLVTAGTLHKQPIFHGPERLDLLHDALLAVARRFGWRLEAWAVFANHYHFIGHSDQDSGTLPEFLQNLHYQTSEEVNRMDHTPGRTVWHNYWDTLLTFERSYLARLNYVHQNPVKHKLVAVANQYPWCSAAWFERTATPAQVKTIYSFKTDKVRVPDDF